MKKKLSKYLFILIFFLLIIEFFSFLFTKLNLLYVNFEPDYIHSYGNKWRTENTIWGSWHKKNHKDVHSSKCFNVTYKSNNIGARDNLDYNFEKIQDSILLIGDSNAEGYAVDFEDSFHQKLQKKITKQILNFGTAGNFGPVQSFLIYKNLASKFNHSEILYFFNPASDFIDNDWNYWKKKIRKFRNRPYYVKNEISGKYEIYYPNKDNSKLSSLVKEIIFLKIQPFFLKYTYTANTLRTINYLYSIKVQKKTKENLNKTTFTGINKSFFNEDKFNIEGTLFFIEKFFEIAKNKKITLILIPHISDLELISRGNEYKNLQWFENLQFLTKKYNVKIINIEDYVNYSSYKKLIHTCDDHWNKYGNDFAAEIVYKKNFN